MTPTTRFVTALAALLLVAAPATAQEAADGLAGAWTLTFSSSQGTVNLPVELNPDGEKLEGASGSALGYQTDFGDGALTADGFSFEIWVEVSGEWYPLDFDGRLEGGELTGNVNIPDGTRSSFRGVRPSER